MSFGALITHPTLTDPHTGRPITADYDLLAIGSKAPKEEMFFHPDMGSITNGQKNTIGLTH